MSTFVLHLSGDPGVDMFWSDWLVVEMEESPTQAQVNDLSEQVVLDEHSVTVSTSRLERALRTRWPSASVRPARLVFAEV